METPTLHADGGLVLRPISSGDLPDLLESYQESRGGPTALPWMYPRGRTIGRLRARHPP